jgi:uncharacterized damage-inducible protein DinB
MVAWGRDMSEDRDALLKHYREMRGELLAAIDGLSDELLAERSLDGWSVAEHLAHLALWDDIRAIEVARISAGYESAWRMTDEQDDAFNGLMHEARRGVPVGQAKWELARARQWLLDAIREATPRGLDDSLYGSAGLRSSHEAQHAGWIRRWRTEKGV